MTNCTLEFVSIHALLAECDPSARFHAVNRAVSIHALLAECDHQPGWGNDDGTCFNPRTPCGVRQSLGLGAVDHGLFQSTHSLRSATQVTYVGGNWDQVSIHALLAECDAAGISWWWMLISFNPRTPCGVRREPRNSTAYTETFQSTHSLRSATWRSGLPYCLCPVSIHALLAECDGGWLRRGALWWSFNPRTP